MSSTSLESEDRNPRVFLSFSGYRSQLVADMLGTMLHAIFRPEVDIFKSMDIEAGAFTPGVLREQLSESDFGILCVTDENQVNPWLLFEAGAISRDTSVPVVPYLIDDVQFIRTNPLVHFGFQLCKADKTGTLKLVEEIAKTFEKPFDSGIKKTFDLSWDPLNKVISQQPGPGSQLTPAYLAELHEASWVMERQPNRTFPRWLRNQILREAVIAVTMAADSRRWKTGLDNYKGEVFKHLRADSPDPEMTVLALCGEKGFSTRDAEAYFRRFYEFAENQAKDTGDKRIRVCRIFVERDNQNDPNQDGDRMVMATVIAKHRECEENGVMAVVITKNERDIVQMYPGFVDRLDAGFGFLVFHTPVGSVAITHEGQTEQLAFSVLDDRLSLRVILDLFKEMAESSGEYKDRAREPQWQELFGRIRLSGRPASRK